jgi:hypothetical protein
MRALEPVMAIRSLVKVVLSDAVGDRGAQQTAI